MALPSKKTPIPESWEGLPVVNAAAMRALDKAAISTGVTSRELMENAGRLVAAECAVFLVGRGLKPSAARVVVCCGRGSNGGDGLVAARHLRAAGAEVAAFLCPPKKDGPDGGRYPELVRETLAAAVAAGVRMTQAGPASGLAAALAACDLAVDALLGTGANGKPAGAIHHMIRELTLAEKPVIAVDVPSGLHPDTGYHSGVFVAADLTLTLGLPKRGLLAPHAQKQVGVLKVLDIGYPPALLKGRKAA